MMRLRTRHASIARTAAGTIVVRPHASLITAMRDSHV
jgi:hypothetical protein